MGLARKVLAGRQLPAGSEDAVQDAFFQFFQHVQLGEYDRGMRRDDLWRILSVITVQKARKQLGREAALKRGGGLVRSETDMAGYPTHDFHLDKLFGSIPTAEYDLICQEMLEQLDDGLREIAILRLAGYSNPQIKILLHCSLRSIERQLQLIRVIWADDVVVQ